MGCQAVNGVLFHQCLEALRKGGLGGTHRAQQIENLLPFFQPLCGVAEVVNFVLRAKAANDGVGPAWTSYEKLRSVIEKKMFANTEDLLPVISFGKKSSSEDERKHQDFVSRMTAKGYTEKQVRLLVDWYMRYRKHH